MEGESPLRWQVEGAVWEWKNKYTGEWYRSGTFRETIIEEEAERQWENDGIRNFNFLLTPEDLVDRIEDILDEKGMAKSDPLPINELQEELETLYEGVREKNGDAGEK